MKEKKKRFFINDTEFYVMYMENYVKLFVIIDNSRFFITDCENLGWAKHYAKVWYNKPIPQPWSNDHFGL